MPNKDGSSDGDKRNESSDDGNSNNNSGGSSDGDGLSLEQQFAILKKENETLNSKYNERNILLTGAQKEIAKARGEAKNIRLKLEAFTKKNESSESDSSLIDKRTQSINEEWEKKYTPVVESNKKLLDIIRNDKIDNALEMSATKYGAIKPSFVKNELKRLVRLDEETLTPYVVDKDGEKEFDGANDMTIDVLVKNFLAKPDNSFLLRKSDKQGSGGSSTVPANTARFSQEQIAKMTPAEFEKHRDKILAQ